MKPLSRTYEEISAGSFLHMEKHITATHVMFHSASKSLLEKTKEATGQNYYKATGGNYHTHEKCIVVKEKQEENTEEVGIISPLYHTC